MDPLALAFGIALGVVICVLATGLALFFAVMLGKAHERNLAQQATDLQKKWRGHHGER